MVAAAAEWVESRVVNTVDWLPLLGAPAGRATCAFTSLLASSISALVKASLRLGCILWATE